MSFSIARWSAVVGLLGAALSVAGAAQAASLPVASFAAVGGRTSVPYGWVDFCRRYDGECDGGVIAPLDVAMTPKAEKEILRVNGWVNSHIEPVSDMDHWGVVDRWDLPTDGKGDCEDYALLKRKLLIEEGFPRQALLMTVVKDEHDEGHAILTVKTSHGEYVLDNLKDEVKPWDRTGYRFVKRQSQSDQNVWVQLGPPASVSVVSTR